MITAKLREAFRVHLEHGGYAIPPGRAACALHAARAEMQAQADEAVSFVWQDDSDADISWMEPHELKAYEQGHLEMLYCFMERNGEVISGIGGVSLYVGD